MTARETVPHRFSPCPLAGAPTALSLQGRSPPREGACATGGCSACATAAEQQGCRGGSDLVVAEQQRVARGRLAGGAPPPPAPRDGLPPSRDRARARESRIFFSAARAGSPCVLVLTCAPHPPRLADVQLVAGLGWQRGRARRGGGCHTTWQPPPAVTASCTPWVPSAQREVEFKAGTMRLEEATRSDAAAALPQSGRSHSASAGQALPRRYHGFTT